MTTVIPETPSRPLSGGLGWNFHRCFSRGQQLGNIRGDFERDGFVCLSSMFAPELVENLLAASSINFQECFRVLCQKGHTRFPRCSRRREGRYEYALGHGVKGGFKEVVMRSPGRFEVPYGCDKAPFSDNSVKNNDRVLAVVRELLSDPNGGATENGDNFYLCNASVVVATPGSTVQGWHADGGHINIDKHDSCHCLNVFIPLVDVSLSLGPTELRPGSHFLTRRLVPMLLAAKARRTLRKTATPLLQAGDALIFDYRLLHRGLPNTDEEMHRPIFVLTFAKKGFKDRLNFPKKSIEDGSNGKVEEEL